MELWTPNRKTIAPMPLCERCGGLTKAWVNANRHHSGFAGWFHGVCCCCLKNVDVTLFGVDAGLCTLCDTDVLMSSLAVDGTYTVPPATPPERTLSGVDLCRYQDCFTGSTWLVTQTPCVGGSPVNQISMLCQIEIRKDNRNVVNVQVLVFPNSTCTFAGGFTAIPFRFLDFGTLIGIPLGDPVSNQFVCGVPIGAGGIVASDGGTATVVAA